MSVQIGPRSNLLKANKSAEKSRDTAILKCQIQENPRGPRKLYNKFKKKSQLHNLQHTVQYNTIIITPKKLLNSQYSQKGFFEIELVLAAFYQIVSVKKSY